jgi:nucleoside-diphosphate-sugar epimerase
MYGQGDDPEKLVPRVVQRAAAGEPYELAPGEQVREWLHVDDGARALLAAASAKPPDSVTTLNVGTGEGQRLVDVVGLVYSLAGAAEQLVRAGAKPYRGREVHRLVMDVSRAERALGGWRASIALREGLAALVGEARAARER